jgi:glycerate kinase
LTAGEAARAIARGWRKVRPKDSIDLLPISDGGDGFGEAMGRMLGAKAVATRTVNAAHRPCVAKWWWEQKTRTAIIESASAIGLAKLPVGRFHPFELDTFGIGQLIEAAAAKGASRCLIGIGGSATNDGGFGFARALGWEFIDRQGCPIELWTELLNFEHIKAPKRVQWFDELLVAVDVQNPLLGKRGATRVYGPQKGLRPKDFQLAERCLRRLALVAKTELGFDFAKVPGSGAAGGLGFGLANFAGGRLEPGFELFADQSNLDERLRRAGLVITGEGCIDHSTLMGKGVGQIARKCNKSRIPCVAVAGVAQPDARLRRTFEQLHALLDVTSKRQAMARATYWLERLSQRIAASSLSLDDASFLTDVPGR